MSGVGLEGGASPARAAWLFEPVDNSALILFRIAFGLLITAESAGAIATGWVGENFVEPRLAFPMIGFEWLQPLPGRGMYAFYALMAVPALLVMLGLYFRLAMAAFTLLWTLTYLLQTVSYNNHYYLLILLCLLLLPAPAHAWASLDARRRPALRSVTCPRWCLLAFVAQIAIVYAYACIAKLNPDWLAGRPVEIWLAARTHYPVLGPLYGEAWMKWMLVYGGILFDGLVVPMLLWRRTRWLAVGLSVFFHLFNSYTFRIGIFPYLGIAFCLFFFPGEELRRWLLPAKPPVPPPPPSPQRLTARQCAIVALLALYFAVQVALPLRHWLYPGDVHWTEEGHRMSWHMMLRTKSGSIVFTVRDPASGESWEVHPHERLTPKQAQRVPTRPDLIWLFVQHLKREYAAAGIEPVEIHARSQVSLNGRPPRPLVRPDVDLARVRWNLIRPNDWIAPLQE